MAIVSLQNKMKLNAELNHEKHSINIKREGTKIFAEIDERKYELDAHEISDGVFLFNLNGKVYEAHVDRNEKKREQFNVHIGNRNFTIILRDPKRLRGSGTGEHEHGEGIAEIVTQMPGKVVRVLVEVGVEVKSGDGIIVVEAMKMQNEMKTPKDGIVKEIKVNTGDTVNGGDVLAIIE